MNIKKTIANKTGLKQNQNRPQIPLGIRVYGANGQGSAIFFGLGFNARSFFFVFQNDRSACQIKTEQRFVNFLLSQNSSFIHLLLDFDIRYYYFLTFGDSG